MTFNYFYEANVKVLNISDYFSTDSFISTDINCFKQQFVSTKYQFLPIIFILVDIDIDIDSS